MIACEVSDSQYLRGDGALHLIKRNKGPSTLEVKVLNAQRWLLIIANTRSNLPLAVVWRIISRPLK